MLLGAWGVVPGSSQNHTVAADLVSLLALKSCLQGEQETDRNLSAQGTDGSTVSLLFLLLLSLLHPQVADPLVLGFIQVANH